MKALVVYDSQFGNTEQIAKAIAGGLGSNEEIRVIKASEATAADIAGLDLLVVGAPTQAGRATVPVQQFLGRIPDKLDVTHIASFDTRVKAWVAKVFGYAANRIGQILEARGGRLVVPPEGFVVRASKGPLATGELERAARWGRDLGIRVSGK